MAVPGGCLDVCPQHLEPCVLHDSSARFAAGGSQPACHVSVENSEALLQTLGTCLDLPHNRGVSASSTRRAGRLSSAGLLATTDWLLGAGPGHPPALESPGCGGGQRSCWCGHPVLARPSRLYPTLGRAVELSVPVLLPGLQPWPGRSGGMDEELGWWKGSGRGFPGAVAAAEQKGTCHLSPGLEVRGHRHLPPHCPLRMPSTRY